MKPFQKPKFQKKRAGPASRAVTVAKPRSREVTIAKPRAGVVTVAKPQAGLVTGVKARVKPGVKPRGPVTVAKPRSGAIVNPKPRTEGITIARPRAGAVAPAIAIPRGANSTFAKKPYVRGEALQKPRPTAKAPIKQAGEQRKLKTLDRVLSKAGLGSRTEARSWIGTGRVQVNGKLIQTPDHWVDLDRDKITLDGKPLQAVRSRYVLIYKPKGYLTTYKDPEGRPTVYDLIPGVDQFLGTVGRLDLDTSGLLLLTNDTQLSERMTNPEHDLSKTYLVKASTLLSDEQLQRLAQGVELSDGMTKPAQVSRQRDSDKYTFLEITLKEGRNRQVRRMLEAVESKALKLVRVKLGPLTLAGLQMGGWRDLTSEEVTALKAMTKPPKRKF